MITVAQLVSAFQEIIGWPYVSPGTNGPNGIDCSGAFVYAFKKYGASIYHGSNRIIRVHCNNPITVTSVSQLKVGMAILKSRTDLSALGGDYQPGGKYYNPALPYDYYHIGLVTSVNPLQIINATSPVARVDTKLSAWSTAAYLNDVDYSQSASSPTPAPTPTPDPGSNPEPDPAPTPVPSTAVTVATSGNTVNLRNKPSTSGIVRARVPLGKTVDVLAAYDSVWWQVRYGKTTGYMMQEFLKANSEPDATPEPAPEPTPSPDPSPDPDPTPDTDPTLDPTTDSDPAADSDASPDSDTSTDFTSDSDPASDSGPTGAPPPLPSTAVTVAPSGSTVNLRKSPSKSSVVYLRVPLGETVNVVAAYDSVWWKVRYKNQTGYMMQEFLKAES